MFGRWEIEMTEEIERHGAELGEWLGRNWKMVVAIIVGATLAHAKIDMVEDRLTEATEQSSRLIELNTEMRIDFARLTSKLGELESRHARTFNQLDGMRDQVAALKSSVSRIDAQRGK